MTEQKVDFQIKSLQLYYQEKHILKSVDLSIYRNRVTALIGPSGCGKSTLLRCLNRMNDLIDGCKIEGTILYQNQDIQTIHPVDLRSKVGMVFQNPNPFPMSIFDNVAYGPRCSGIKNKAKLKEIVVDSLQKAALYEEVKDRLKDPALGLSGGQQQRLCIARTIAMHPEVILMDEPTSALDPIAESQTYEQFDLLARGKTALYISHRLASTRFCDRVLLISGGRVQEEGTHESLLRAGGEYAHMFQVQSQYYQKGAEEA